MLTTLALLFVLDIADIMVHYGTHTFAAKRIVFAFSVAQNSPESARFLLR